MAWRAANCLLSLQDAFNAKYPQRSKVNDGIINDAAHAARTSDHNPNAAGVVLALDITNDPVNGPTTAKVADYMIAHPDARLRYIISNRRIAGDQSFINGNYPGKKPWTWLPYSGSNPHSEHMHFSAEKTAALYDDSRQWDIGPGTPSVPLPPPVLDQTPDYLRRGSLGDDVSVLQWLLRTAVDGDFGVNTDAAVRLFQQQHGLEVDGIVGHVTWDKIREVFPAPGGVIIPSPPVVPSADVQKNITATVFGGGSDLQRSAYDGHVISDSEMAVALPFRFSGTRPRVKVTNVANGKSAVGTIEDIGPWNINDAYWKTGQRPQAETGTDLTGRHTNHAGIDLSPALARAIGIDGKGSVDWSFE